MAVRYDKTQRQLLLFEIIFKSQEIIMPEVMKRLSVSRKTIQRDIDDLTDAGLVKLEYTRKDNAYIKRKGTDIAAAGINEPEGTLRHMHLKKLRRLVRFMIELSDMEDVSDFTRENFSPNDNNLYFMYSLLVSLNLHQEVHSRSYISQVEPMIIQIPCLEEQQKIADFLSTFDEAISYAKQELEKWKELKKGLLQQMFV